jgi:hypothetical protein
LTRDGDVGRDFKPAVAGNGWLREVRLVVTVVIVNVRHRQLSQSHFIIDGRVATVFHDHLIPTKPLKQSREIGLEPIIRSRVANAPNPVGTKTICEGKVVIATRVPQIDTVERVDVGEYLQWRFLLFTSNFPSNAIAAA